VQKDRPFRVRALIERGASVNVVVDSTDEESPKFTLLHLTAHSHSDTRVAKLLIEARANVNARSRYVSNGTELVLGC